MSQRIFQTTAFALICITTIAQAASAQTVSLPNLDFPDATTGWGCKFSNSCPTTPDVTRGNS